MMKRAEAEAMVAEKAAAEADGLVKAERQMKIYDPELGNNKVTLI